MAELLPHAPYSKDYPEALGDEIDMDPEMRRILLISQQTIFYNIEHFPYNIPATRRGIVAGMFPITHKMDLSAAMDAVFDWNVLDEVDISKKNRFLVGNNSLLALIALASVHSGIYRENKEPYPSVREIPNDQKGYFITHRALETRGLMGDSLLANYILDPQRRKTEARLRADRNRDRKRSRNGTVESEELEIPGLNAGFFTAERRALLEGIRLSDLAAAAEDQRVRGFNTHPSQLPAPMHWVLKYVANAGNYDKARSNGNGTEPRYYTPITSFTADKTTALAEALKRSYDTKIAAAVENQTNLSEDDLNPELMTLVDRIIQKRVRDGKPV